jgi:hypothetical protein
VLPKGTVTIVFTDAVGSPSVDCVIDIRGAVERLNIARTGRRVDERHRVTSDRRDRESQ